MTTQDVATAMQRMAAVLQRRPDTGLHDDAPATARWAGGTRVVASHASGMQLSTDMPLEFGGSGDRVTPGWLLRAGLASCCATRIAMGAAAEGIVLASLDVEVRSRSDTRGLLGMAGHDGATVPAGPADMQLLVKIGAPGVSPQRLRALVQDCQRCSPVSGALQAAVPLDLHVEVDEGAAA
jgi:uncharacterized OsmC-like protein